MWFLFLLWWIQWLCWKICSSCSWRGVWCFCSNSNWVSWWRFSVGCVHTKRSWVQRQLTHRNIVGPKILIFPPRFKFSFVALVLFWPHSAHSSLCNFFKNMTQSRPVEPICRPSDCCRGVSREVDFVWWVDGREPQMHGIWCLRSDGITGEVHPTEWIVVCT